VASVKWAREGGLKDESRMSNVRIAVADGGAALFGTDWKMENLAGDFTKLSTKAWEALRSV
jgi:hypothetical protein